MSLLSLAPDNHDRQGEAKPRESLRPRDQLVGHLIWLVFLLLALVLQSMVTGRLW